MELKVGDIVEGKVVTVKEYGVFVDLADGVSGMVHISEVANGFVNDINDFIKVGDTVKTKVVSIGEDSKIALSIKRALPPEKKNDNYKRNKEASQNYKPDPTYVWTPKKSESASFEEMMNKFKASSDEKFSDLKHKNPDVRRSRRGTK